MTSSTPLLDQINCPSDLRKLKESDLTQVAQELRAETINTVAVTGGHLGSGLGVVELTVALHHVFNTPDDRIIMDLDVKKDAIGALVPSGANGGTIPTIDTKKVSTQVLVDNGDTIVLGGIFEQETRTTVDKVPFLGDIPVLGYLFRRTNKLDNKTELLIFVTPKIVKDTLTVR